MPPSFETAFPGLPNSAEVYRNNLRNREYAKEAPCICAALSDAEAAKLKKFGGAGGRKFSGCPTQAETDSSGYFGIKDEEGPSYYFRHLRLFIKDRVWPIGRLQRAFAGMERHEPFKWKELLDWILRDKPSENQGGKIESLVKSLAKIEVALSRDAPPPPIRDCLFLRITEKEGVTIG